MDSSKRSSGNSSAPPNASSASKKPKSSYSCVINYGHEMPSVPLDAKLISTPLSETVMNQYTEYMAGSLEMSEPVPLIVDFFAGLKLDLVDPSYYQYPTELGNRIIDPEDACLMAPDLLDEARNNTSLRVSVPSATVVNTTYDNLSKLTHEFKMETNPVTGVTRKVIAFKKPITYATAAERRNATMEALRTSSLIFLNKPEYAEDKLTAWAHQQDLLRRGQQLAAEGKVEEVEEEVLTPTEYIEASFEAVKAAPVHPDPTKRDMVPIVRPLLPDLTPRGNTVWVHYTRSEDVTEDKAQTALPADEVRAVGAQMVLMRERGGYGQYKRKRDSVTVGEDEEMDEESKRVLESSRTDGVWVWCKELCEAPVPKLAGDDNFYLVRGENALIGRIKKRITVRRRVASPQDPCEDDIASRPAVLLE